MNDEDLDWVQNGHTFYFSPNVFYGEKLQKDIQKKCMSKEHGFALSLLKEINDGHTEILSGYLFVFPDDDVGKFGISIALSERFLNKMKQEKFDEIRIDFLNSLIQECLKIVNEDENIKSLIFDNISNADVMTSILEKNGFELKHNTLFEKNI